MKRWKQTPKTYSEMNVCDDGEWVRYIDAEDEKIAYGHASFENGRKQGAAEGRAKYGDWWPCSRCGGKMRPGLGYVCDELEMTCTCCGHRAMISREAWLIFPSRDASEPRCTCRPYLKEGHYQDCPCYKPEKPRCTCGQEEWIHTIDCPCYKPSKKLGDAHGPIKDWMPNLRDISESKPLEKLPTYDAGVSAADCAFAINALVDHVTAIEEELRRERGKG